MNTFTAHLARLLLVLKLRRAPENTPRTAERLTPPYSARAAIDSDQDADDSPDSP